MNVRERLGKGARGEMNASLDRADGLPRFSPLSQQQPHQCPGIAYMYCIEI